jgi:HK97 family phage prohead protease
MERRWFNTELAVRQQPTGGIILEGHAAVFNKVSRNLGGFVEQVAPDAFAQTLAEGPDVRALFNHDPSLILGRTTAGTVRLSTDASGLYYSVDVPDTSVGRDLAISIERGDITQSSFGFYVTRDAWTQTNDGFPLRTLEAVDLNDGDVSPVTYPAYPQTDSGLAEAVRSLAEVRGMSVRDAVELAKAGTLAELLHPSEDDDPTVDERQSVPLSVVRARLALMARATHPAS